MRLFIAIAAIAVALLAAFYAGGYVATSRVTQSHITAPEILFEAHRQVPEPILPKRPAGRVVTTSATKTTIVPTPRTIRAIGSVFAPPRVIIENKQVQETVQVTNLIEASPAEIKDWNDAVDHARSEYDLAIQAKSAEIARQTAMKNRELLITQAKELTKDLLIPLIATISGLITALAALRWGKTVKPATPSE